jgi:hypothetical protein
VDSDVIDQRLIKFSMSGRYWRKSGSIMAQYMSYLQISRKPTTQVVGKDYTVL